MRKLSLIVGLVAALAGEATAICQNVPGGGLTCSSQQDIAGVAEETREISNRVRTSLCIEAVSGNTDGVRCGPMPVTTTTGVEIGPGAFVGYCWNDLINGNPVANATFGCVAESGTQNVVRAENYK